MSFIESINLFLGIIGSTFGLAGFYFSLSNFLNKRPKLIDAFWNVGAVDDKKISIKLVCIENTRIEEILLIDVENKNKIKLYPKYDLHLTTYYPPGEHKIDIPYSEKIDKFSKHEIYLKTNHDRVLGKNKYIRKFMIFNVADGVPAGISISIHETPDTIIGLGPDGVYAHSDSPNKNINKNFKK